MVNPEDVAGVGFSTHSLSLGVISSLLIEATRAKISILGIQPKNTEFGEGLSTEAVEAVRRITRVLVKSLSGIRPEKGGQSMETS